MMMIKHIWGNLSPFCKKKKEKKTLTENKDIKNKNAEEKVTYKFLLSPQSNTLFPLPNSWEALMISRAELAASQLLQEPN